MSRERNSRKVNVHSDVNVINAPIININDYKPDSAGLIYDGSKIEVRFPLPFGKVEIYDFTKFIGREVLTVALAIAFYGWGADKIQETRSCRFYFLGAFYTFLDYLKNEMNQNITSTLDIDKSLLNSYVSWLNKPKTIKRGDKIGEEMFWGVKSRRVHLTALTNLLIWLRREHPEYINENYRIPVKPWRDIDKKNEPTRTLSNIEIGAIEVACLNKIKEISSYFEQGRLLILSVMSNFNGQIDDLLNHDSHAKHETIRIFNEYVDALNRLANGIPTASELISRQKKGLLKITVRSVAMEAGLSRTGLCESAAYDDILQAIRNKKYNVSKKTDCNDIDIGDILTYIYLKYDSVIPTNFEDKRLNKAMQYVLHKYDQPQGREIGFFSKYITVSPVDLVPYIVILTSRGFWNSEAILKAPRTGMWKDHPLRPNRVAVSLYKGRSGGYNTRTFEKGGLAPIDLYLEQVLEITKPLVNRVHEEYKDRLFLFRTIFGEVTTFTNSSGGASGDTWYRSLNSFIKDNDLPKFTLRNLRMTGSNLAHKVTRGDLKASQVVLNHKSIKTTISYYESDAMSLRNYQKITDLQKKYLEWGRNNAQIIIPAYSESINILSTNNAVTDGFTCKNPYKSPFNDEGTLCKAWLGCFHCENSVVIKDSATLARLLQLKEQLIFAKNRINVDRFLLLYQSKLSIIENGILPEFNDEKVWQEANKIIQTLTDLPDIE